MEGYINQSINQYPFINEKMSKRTLGQKMGEINGRHVMRDVEYMDMVDKTTNRNKCIRVCYLLGTLKKLNCTVFRKGWTKVLGKVR